MIEQDKLVEHTKYTIQTLETRLNTRGITTGLKAWEKKILLSAYDALDLPDEERKFGLVRGTRLKGITKTMGPRKDGTVKPWKGY